MHRFIITAWILVLTIFPINSIGSRKADEQAQIGQIEKTFCLAAENADVRGVALDDSTAETLRLYVLDRSARIFVYPVTADTDEDPLTLEREDVLDLTKVVQEAKAETSQWLKRQLPAGKDFAWQAGYGAFSVGASLVADVK